MMTFKPKNEYQELSLLELFLRRPIDYNAIRYNFIPSFRYILTHSCTENLCTQIGKRVLNDRFQNIRFDKNLESFIPYILVISHNLRMRKRIENKHNITLDKRRALIFKFLDYLMERYKYDELKDKLNDQNSGPISLNLLSKETYKNKLFHILNDKCEGNVQEFNSFIDHFDNYSVINRPFNELFNSFVLEHEYILDDLRKSFFIELFRSITKYIINTYQKYFIKKHGHIKEVKILPNYAFRNPLYGYENYPVNNHGFNNNYNDVLYTLYVPECSWKVCWEEMYQIFLLNTHTVIDEINCNYKEMLNTAMLIQLIFEDNSSVLLTEGVHTSKVDNFNLKYPCSIIINENTSYNIEINNDGYINEYNSIYKGNLYNLIEEVNFYNNVNSDNLIKVLYIAYIKDNQNIEIVLQ